MSLRAVIYTRISRDDTGEGEANERQEKACRMLAEMRGWQVVDVRKDISISAYTGAERPGWNEVKALMASGEVDVVLAWKLDRVTRTVSGLVELVQLCKDTDTLFATTDGQLDLTSPTGKAVATILAAVAQMEVELKAERQEAANQQRRAEGKPWNTGFRAFGYDHDMTVRPDEADLLREAAQDVLKGATLRSIANRWRDLGVSTPRSVKGVDGWTHRSVKSILLNPRNAGLQTYKGDVVGEGTWEPIIELGTHHQLVALLNDPDRLTRQTGSAGRAPSNLLTSIARCARCGETVSAGSANGKKVYKCPSEHLTTPRFEMDNFVLSVIQMSATVTLAGRYLDIPAPEAVEDVAEELREVVRRQSQITEAFAAGAIPASAWQSANESLNVQRTELEARMASADDRPGADASTRAAKLIRELPDLDLDTQRRILRDRFAIYLHPRDRKRNVPMSRQATILAATGGPKPHGVMELLLGEHPEAGRLLAQLTDS